MEFLFNWSVSGYSNLEIKSRFVFYDSVTICSPHEALIPYCGPYVSGGKYIHRLNCADSKNLEYLFSIHGTWKSSSWYIDF